MRNGGYPAAVVDPCTKSPTEPLAAPTALQARVWPALAQADADLVAVGPSGCGKTLAYLLPCFAEVFARRRAVAADGGVVEAPDGPLALVAVPTRELAMRVSEAATRLGAPQGIGADAVFGERACSPSVRELSWRAWVCVGTPGCLAAGTFVGEGGSSRVRTANVTTLVLDGADRLLRNSLVELGELWERLGSVRAMLFDVELTDRVREFAEGLNRAVVVDVGGGVGAGADSPGAAARAARKTRFGPPAPSTSEEKAPAGEEQRAHRHCASAAQLALRCGGRDDRSES